ncbi:MAG: DUF2283 domain-containing protein [Nanohaloarchaea archaeon SW_7_43_1]|nr:MAG: DUF2283 domain-containing protein [Nanohaloarchaea archaeon SW_7_43_1]
MDLSFDSEADAVYIRFSDRDIKDSNKIDERTIVDVDEDQEIVGIEVLEASERFNEISSLNVDFEPEEMKA